MRSILFIILGLGSVVAFGQSKRKINRQLTSELVVLKSEYDSVTALALKRSSELQIKQTGFLIARKRNEQRQATDLTDAFSKVEKEYNRLMRLEKDPDKLVNLTKLKEEIEIFEEEQADVFPSDMLERQYPLLLDEVMIDIKSKLKLQNDWLRVELTRYSQAKEQNSAKITEMENISTAIDDARPGLDSIYLGYEQVIYNLAIGQSVLLDSIQKLRDLSLRDWPKNFTSVFEREFGKPERNEISQPTGEGSITNIYYTYANGPFLGDFIRYANPIPISEFSVEKMKSQGSIIRRFDPDPTMIYSYVDEQAEFPGGRVALMQFIRDNFHISETAADLGWSFKLRMKFVVLEDGSLMDITVYKGTAECPPCEKEAIRVIRSMPKWKPAKQKGRAVKSWYNLPITIHLH
jgi:hypothetical protein